MDATALGLYAGVSCTVWTGAFMLLGRKRSVRVASPAWERSVLHAKLRVDALLLRFGPWAQMVADAERRRKRSVCLKEMPQLLDVVTLGLLSGLSFDASLELYCARFDTELSQAFGRALLTWRMGNGSRESVLSGLADDLDVQALRRFASVVSQALTFGSPLASVLESQAQAIREEQRGEVEEEIEKVPVRMLIPLGTLIVPAMLLAILGPLLGSTVGMA